MASQPVKLNLGSGARPIDGYRNIDIKNGEQAFPLGQYATNSVDEVRASHLLEHYSHHEAARVLAEWVRVLKPGGKLFVAVPDFERISRAYLDGQNMPVQQYIMGGHVDEHDYHKCLWDKELLTEAMEYVGLTDIQPWPGDNGDCSTFPISLNLVGTKADTKPGPFDWLAQHAQGVYSQHGEDGIIGALLDRLPQDSLTKTCVEIGASDGVFMSNTRNLIEQRGYSAIWCEKDPVAAQACYDQLQAQGYADRVQVCGGEVNAQTIVQALGDLRDPDVMSIDVDGQELNIWNAVPICAKAKIVIVEFDPTRDDDLIPTVGDTWQHGIRAVEKVAAALGYVVVVTMGCNAICVRHSLAQFVTDPDWEGPAPDDKRTIGKKIAAVMSMPRLAFTDNMFCAFESLVPLGIRLTRSSGVFWNQCLTEMIEDAIRDGFAYVLTVDYDTVFTTADVKALYRLMEAHPEADAICAMQVKRSSEHVLFTVQNDKGEAVTELEYSALEGDLLRVHTAHMGLTLFRCAAFPDVERPWLQSVPDETGRWSKPAIVDGKPQGGKMDADIAFWARWAKAGKTIYQANRVVIGHMQLVVTWPGPSLAPVHQLAYDYSQTGKPTEGIWQ